MGQTQSQPISFDDKQSTISSSTKSSTNSLKKAPPPSMNFFEMAAVTPQATRGTKKKPSPTSNDKLLQKTNSNNTVPTTHSSNLSLQTTKTNNSEHSNNSNNSNNSNTLKKKAPPAMNFFGMAASTPQPLPPPAAANQRKASTQSSGQSSKASSISSSGRYPPSASLMNSTLGGTTLRNTIIDSRQQRNKVTLDDDTISIRNRTYYKPTMENGDVSFMLPCDDDESDRLMTLHYILKTVFYGNFISPVREILKNKDNTNKPKVLDIGCGSGTWILEMASEFPNTEFYGVDQCPLFPSHIKPPNAHFQKHEINNNTHLPFQSNQFDFVYIRMVVLHLTPDAIVALLTDIARVLKPGGYVEVVETDYMIRPSGSNHLNKINETLHDYFYSSSVSPPFTRGEASAVHPLFTHLMLSSVQQQRALPFYGEFMDISQHHTPIPLGWGESLGTLFAENYTHFLSSLARTRGGGGGGGGEKDEVLLTTDMQAIIESCQLSKSTVNWYICFARKPFHKSNNNDGDVEYVSDKLEQSTLDSIYEFVEGFHDDDYI